VNFFNLTDQVAMGTISNMYDIGLHHGIFLYIL